MRIVVYPHSLELGGSQLNAVELALEVRRRGHDVVVFGPDDGPLAARVRESDVPFVVAPPRPRFRPSPKVMRALVGLARDHRADVVHAYEWPPILESFYGGCLVAGFPMIGTVMSMGVAPFIPRDVPLVVGTRRIAAAERVRRDVVHVLEPPVDLETNHPDLGLDDVRPVAGAGPDDLLLVVVGRLARELKLEGVLAAARTVHALGDPRLRLAVVGDGPAQRDVADVAREVNQALGRPAVTLVGEVEDPRPWYAAADVVLGMGGSALRGMAFAKPLVVQGERGFWRLLSPDTLDLFAEQGWYGVGDGGSGVAALSAILGPLLVSDTARKDAGAFALSVVQGRYSLSEAARRQVQMYEQAVTGRRSRLATGARSLHPAGAVVRYEAVRRIHRWRGRSALDDFNAIASQPGHPPTKEH